MNITSARPFEAIAGTVSIHSLHGMKVYNLICAHDHRFEGWFSSEGDFKAQSDAHMIECPVCENHSVRKLPSAPRLNLSGVHENKSEAEHTQKQFLEIVRKIVGNTEDVGERFAEEARRIHYNEAPERAIRGVASAQEFAELTDEGIDVLPLPLSDIVKRSLQ